MVVSVLIIKLWIVPVTFPFVERRRKGFSFSENLIRSTNSNYYKNLLYHKQCTLYVDDISLKILSFNTEYLTLFYLS